MTGQQKRDRKKRVKPARVIYGCGCVKHPIGGQSPERYTPESCPICRKNHYHPRYPRDLAIKVSEIAEAEMTYGCTSEIATRLRAEFEELSKPKKTEI